jgi:hypothetical protein
MYHISGVAVRFLEQIVQVLRRLYLKSIIYNYHATLVSRYFQENLSVDLKMHGRVIWLSSATKREKSAMSESSWETIKSYMPRVRSGWIRLTRQEYLIPKNKIIHSRFNSMVSETRKQLFNIITAKQFYPDPI